MTVTIKHDCDCKEVLLGTLEQGDTFMYKDTLYQVKGLGYKTPTQPANFIVVTELRRGKSERLGLMSRVEPVDIEITVMHK